MRRDGDVPDVVTVDRVTKRYGATAAVKELSLTVGRGEMFGLIGPDGAGKTTTIRLICGLLRADAGAIRVLGFDPLREHRKLTASVGYLSQRFSLYGDLSIDENIAFFAEIHGVGDYRARRDRLLDLTQLTPHRTRLADRLSGGMKQKLALACTLVHEPALLMLDEPTTGVDPVSRREFWKLLAEFLSQGITIVMATPYLDEAERCARVALLHEGRLLALDRPDQLRSTLPGSLFEVIVSDHRRAPEVLARLDDVADVQMFGERAHVRLNRAGADAGQRLSTQLAAAGLGVASVRPITTSLEDVFIARLHEEQHESAHARG
jgi:ABC-2 type transport system ATP-binding protein